MERTGRFLLPRHQRTVRQPGRRPGPRQGDTPWTPGPLSLPPPCSRTVLAVKGALRKIFSKPERIFLRRAETARP
jgi:hypothetical protein